MVSPALAQFGEGLFGVGRARDFACGQARAALGGEIAGELDLFGQRQHVRIERALSSTSGWIFFVSQWASALVSRPERLDRICE